MRERNPRVRKEKKKKVPRFMRVRYSGRNVLLAGAVLLLAMSGYELWTRFETISKMIGAFRQGYETLQLYERSGIPFIRYLYVSMLKTAEGTEIINIIIFLTVCTILAVLVFCFRNRPRAGYLLIALDTAVFCVGFFVLMVFSLSTGDLLQIAKLLPLVLVLLGCLVNLYQYYEHQRFLKKNPSAGQPVIPPQSAIPQQPAVPLQQPDAYIPRHAPSGPYFESNRSSENKQ
ncbi:MAG: hypothetical protein Q4G19_05570 [Clostridia bacterium]|nr:hypothetical protein [Clostridia bacterium]